jgi:hypothetical protein
LLGKVDNRIVDIARQGRRKLSRNARRKPTALLLPFFVFRARSTSVFRTAADVMPCPGLARASERANKSSRPGCLDPHDALNQSGEDRF